LFSSRRRSCYTWSALSQRKFLIPRFELVFVIPLLTVGFLAFVDSFGLLLVVVIRVRLQADAVRLERLPGLSLNFAPPFYCLLQQFRTPR
jgi:hypothetical protein